MLDKERLVVLLAKNDDMYQTLLKMCGELEPEYARICNALSDEDRAMLDRYIGICEELEHQKVRLALSLLTA